MEAIITENPIINISSPLSTQIFIDKTTTNSIILLPSSTNTTIDYSFLINEIPILINEATILINQLPV